MNPRRWRVAFRWCLGLAALLSAAGWLLGEVWGLSATGQGAQRAPSVAAPDAAQNNGPDREQFAASLRAALRVVQRQAGASPLLAPPDMRLLRAPDATANAEPPPARLSLILFSAKGRLAIIDNAIYAPSERLPDGRVVAAIERDGVLLRNGRRLERLPWAPLDRVELRRPIDPAQRPRAILGDEERSEFAPDAARLLAPELQRALRLDENESRGVSRRKPTTGGAP
jgi:hypothetical protein